MECFGIIALEALACGKPTLVTPIGALPEVMRDFETNWIARDASVQGIADLLSSFLNKQLPPASYGDIRNLLDKKYSFETALSAHERLYLNEAV